MATIPSWPASTDDTGTGQDGTVLDEAFFDAMEAAIATEVQSPSYPGVTAGEIITEVGDARGSTSSLDDRLDVSLNEDGSLRGTALEAAASGFRDFNMPNLLRNDNFRVWHLGDTSAPTGWTLAGAGAAVARTGGVGVSPLADTNSKHGTWACRLTSGGGADARLTQQVIGFSLSTVGWSSRKLAFGCRVKASVTNVAHVILNDGATSTVSAGHDGNATGGPQADGWEWLYGVHTISASANILQVELRCTAGANVAYFSGAYAGFSGVAPNDWVPSARIYQVHKVLIPGNIAVGNGKGYIVLPFVGYINSFNVIFNTAPSGTAAVLDVKIWDSVAAAWQTAVLGGAGISCAAANTFVVASSYAGTTVPAEFHRSCITGVATGAGIISTGTTPGDHSVLRVDVLTDDGGNTAADATVSVLIGQYSGTLVLDA